MSFVVAVEHRFRGIQGLSSPVRARRGLAALPAGQGVDVTLRAGVAFDDDQLTDRGWFFDTDSAAEIIEAACADLATRPWTQVFAFRPTFELVAREMFRRLSDEIPQLEYVEIRDETFAVTTRYVPGR